MNNLRRAVLLLVTIASYPAGLGEVVARPVKTAPVSEYQRCVNTANADYEANVKVCERVHNPGRLRDSCIALQQNYRDIELRSCHGLPGTPL